MNIDHLRNFTPARVALGRTGSSLPAAEWLAFQMAHAAARDAVRANLDTAVLALELKQKGWEPIILHSAAPDRSTYLRRPDLGRQLGTPSRLQLRQANLRTEIALIVADGLSALAIQRHAVPLIEALHWAPGPILFVEQGRVAIGDDIGQVVEASLSVVLIGERPGLSSPDSLGVYITYQPKPGRTDAERNCISNIRSEGLSYEVAAYKLSFLIQESLRRKLSGVALKEEAGNIPPQAASIVRIGIRKEVAI